MALSNTQQLIEATKVLNTAINMNDSKKTQLALANFSSLGGIVEGAELESQVGLAKFRKHNVVLEVLIAFINAL